MQKAKIFNGYLCVFVALSLSGSAIGQPVLGQFIEQTKKNKLSDLLEPQAPKPTGATGGTGGVTELAPVTKVSPSRGPVMPALWSLSGINSRLTAEIWDKQEIHRVSVAPGQTLPGGWTVVTGDINSLTLQQGKKKHTLYPASLGTTGSEYALLKKPVRLDAALLGGLLGDDRNSGFQMPAPMPPPSAGPAFAPATPSPSDLSKQALPVTAARDAAGKLPPAAK